MQWVSGVLSPSREIRVRATLERVLSAVLATSLVLSIPAVALATPGNESSSTSTTSSVTPVVPNIQALDAATTRVLELEGLIEDHKSEDIAITERIDVVNLRMFEQQDLLAATRIELGRTKTVYQGRLVRIYKNRTQSPVQILLEAESLSDFVNWALLLTRIAEQDQIAYKQAIIAAADAEYQASVLDDLKAQLVELQRIQRVSTEELEEALGEQHDLVARLNESSLQLLAARRTATKTTRREWLDGSIPIGAPIPMTVATVEPYSDLTFTVPAHQPLRYVVTGQAFSAVCSWYGPGFNGRLTASGQVFNQDDFTCASRTLPFGTRLALTRGNRRIIVVVNDRGPFIAGRDLDLSKAAAEALGFSGVQTVQAEFVSVAGTN